MSCFVILVVKKQDEIVSIDFQYNLKTILTHIDHD